jgi:ABC-type Fe3+-hydroxamate transport system substrate-binding protein
MHLRGPSAALFFILLSISLAGLLAGCAGGGDQAGNGGDGSGEKQQGEKQQGGTTQAKAPQVKIALGRVVSVKPDRRKIILRPSSQQQGNRLVFKVVDNAQISLDDQKAEMADVKEDQQAKVEYVTTNDQNRARVLELISPGEGTGG